MRRDIDKKFEIIVILKYLIVLKEISHPFFDKFKVIRMKSGRGSSDINVIGLNNSAIVKKNIDR